LSRFVSIRREAKTAIVEGKEGMHSFDGEIYCGASGTLSRFMIPFACLGKGEVTITGSQRLSERPITEIIMALKQMGGRIEGERLPLVTRGGFSGGKAELDCSRSSQFASGIILSGAASWKGIDIRLEKLVSKKYVDMTLHVMKMFGIKAINKDYRRILAKPQVYKACEFKIESDPVSASYFFNMAAISGGRITVEGYDHASVQEEARYVDILEKMGCIVTKEGGRCTVTGRKLRSVNLDMSDMPDVVQSLAVLACVAEGTTVMRNIGHLRHKESNRLDEMAMELRKLGAKVSVSTDSMAVTGGKIQSAELESHGDHRTAMGLACLAFSVPISIRQPEAVSKSYPSFWDELKKMGVSIG